MTNIMLDLETMGSSPTAAIVAIGAVKFNKHTIKEEFYQPVKLSSSVEEGMTIDADTVEWWMRRDDQARQLFSDENACSLFDALCEFSNWIGEDAIIWGNGADFDNVILASAYRLTGLKQPWHWHNNRCYRTMKNLCAEIETQRIGTHHHALDDAKTQALHLISILKSIEIESPGLRGDTA